MSSSYLPLLFFRRDDDNDETADAVESSKHDSSMDADKESEDDDEDDQEEEEDADEEEQGPSSWQTRHASSLIMEYSDTDDDDRRHFSTSPTTPSWLAARAPPAGADDASDTSSRQRNWMKQLADSFRPQRKHRRRVSSKNLLREYPQLVSSTSILASTMAEAGNLQNTTTEQSPLLRDSKPKADIAATYDGTTTRTKPPLAGKEETKKTKLHPFYTALAASFLQDYEASRRPLLGRASDVSKITWHQLQLHQIKYSGWFFSINLFIATLALFVSSALEEQANEFEFPSFDAMHNVTMTPTATTGTISRRLWLTGLNVYAICVLAVDLWIRNELMPVPTVKSTAVRRPSASLRQQRRPSLTKGSARAPHLPTSLDRRDREARSSGLVKPLILFLLVLGLETMARLGISYWIMNKDDEMSETGQGDGDFDDYGRFQAYSPQGQHQQPMILFSSLLKPLVLFFVSHRARDALEALGRILRIVIRVLFMESLIILMFAAVACRLFNDFEPFRNLSSSWLSLFKLSTTVVNPSLWMPMYEASKFSAFFFVFFIVTAVFYLHSLVLSVVFQTYVLAAAEIHERGVADREEAVHLSYLALRQHDPSRNVISTQSVRELLCQLRPHYNSYKISALVDIVDPHGQMFVEYSTYRTKIRQALNASIRTARTASTLAMSVELLAVTVAIVNFIYVVLVSSAFDFEWFDRIEPMLGILITAVAAVELVVRFNPLRISDFTPLTRLNATFDGLAILAALISSIGILLYASDAPMAMELLLTGRAVDIFRVMRFFAMFRDVVRRSADVLPVLIGPCVLVVTTLHVFVYLGMALWGGAVEVGQHGDLVELYDLNNFNSYQEGLVTMFNVLVVNDWHAIAEVFLYADRCSSAFIVMPFFVLGNLVGVSIMLNVMTAFFVQAFVTKLDDETVASPASAHKVVQHHKPSDASLRPSENASVRISSSTTSSVQDHGADADSEGSSDSDFLEFDVYEREGFDKIMQTVAGVSSSETNVARDICDYLEIFEKLAPDREGVGYLVCDQLTMERFGNLRFQTTAEGFIEPNELHVAVSEMHAELLALADRTDRNRSLIRTYPHHQRPDQESFEITAALIRRHPALSLFVSRRRRASQT